MFFTLHDPHHVNRQGYDVGTQYRSPMFYETTGERIMFEEAMKQKPGPVAAPDIVAEDQPAAKVPCGQQQDFYAKVRRALQRHHATRSWPRRGNITLHGLKSSAGPVGRSLG